MTWKRFQQILWGTSIALRVLAVYFVVNFWVQLARKPTEILSFGVERRSFDETWRKYERDFAAAATPSLSSSFLAALAQHESAGNPWASPPWQVGSRRRGLFSLYTPASTSVGLYQFTEGTFRQAIEKCPRETCDHWVKTRLSGALSIKLTSHYLEQELADILQAPKRARARSRPRKGRGITVRQKQRLAAIIHLCGADRAREFARGTIGRNAYCGTHHVQTYVDRVMSYQQRFERIARLRANP